MTPQDKYNRENTTFYGIRLNHKTDGYLVDMLAASENRQGLIKRALAEYYDNHRLYTQDEAPGPRERLRGAIADAERAADTIRAVLAEMNEESKTDTDEGGSGNV